VAEIARGAGTRFDPEVVRALLELDRAGTLASIVAVQDAPSGAP